MSIHNDFDFGDESFANSYENILVPVIFDPWAKELIKDYPIWHNKRILDLAAGSGIVTRLLSEIIGTNGSIVAADVNSEMLSVAKELLGEQVSNITFIESSAESLNKPSDSFDIVVCQQGFQFFPDKLAATKEIHRLLAPGGKVIISTWLPVSECHYFGVICDSLISIDEAEISNMMRVPFDFIDRDELINHFENANFNSISVNEKRLPLTIPGGVEQAIKVAYATPIGTKLRDLDDEKQEQFRQEMKERLNILTDDGVTMGQLATNILEAEKQ